MSGIRRPTRKNSFGSTLKNAQQNPHGVAGQMVPGGSTLAAAISSGTSMAGSGSQSGSSIPSEMKRTAANFRVIATELERLAQQLDRKGHPPPSASEKQAACRKLQQTQQTLNASQVTISQSISALEND